MKPHSTSAHRLPGYILLELIIALSIFSMAVVGLSMALNNTLQTANMLNKDYAVRLAMRSFLEEIKRKPLADMATSLENPQLDLVLTSTVEPLEIRSKEGRAVEDIYTLTVRADYTAGGRARDETVFLWVNVTDEEDKRRKTQ
jgi:type II secretory pathway pseudopilin PulG